MATETIIPFLHCINLNDKIVRHNLCLPVGFSTPLYTNIFFAGPQLYPNFYTTEQYDLLYQSDTILHGAMTRTGHVLIMGSCIRKGIKLSTFEGNPIEIPRSNFNYYLEKSNLEHNVEQVRKESYNHRPCRITSFYLVDNSIEGRTVLQNMFGSKFLNSVYKPHIMEVKIEALIKVHRADIRWLDEFQRTGNVAAIHSYWKGAAFDHHPRYEYLVEGLLHACRKEDIHFVRSLGPVWPGSDQYWQDIDSAQYSNWFRVA